MTVDVAEMKAYIESAGYKQKAIAEKIGMGEANLCQALLGKRKLEAGEYAGICNAIGVPMSKFIHPQMPEETAV
ncbi:MAG: helix-turn-helix transcriptional regulator [Clostridiales bacterium]|nr:helix-turn-helix transcriptional regulator [Clostridiales bacterium]